MKAEELSIGAVFLAVVTAYCIGPDAPGPFTFSGIRPSPGWTIAAGRELPIGALVNVSGVGYRQVHDRGGAIGTGRLDLFVSSCEEARAWGVQSRSVAILWTPPIGPVKGRMSMDGSHGLHAERAGTSDDLRLRVDPRPQAPFDAMPSDPSLALSPREEAAHLAVTVLLYAVLCGMFLAKRVTGRE